MKSDQLTPLSRAITILCGFALIVVLFVPLWQIEFNAPQYPEGLIMKMHPHRLSGNVDIINGLNHYIGMKTLHTKDFVEFTLLPYFIGFFAIMCFLVAIVNKKKWLPALFAAFLIFGIIAMVDFWRWEYNYGHELDPNAPIQVPGMSYQPPLIGYKQLLNFGVYSIPDIGGWIFIGVGLLLLAATILQLKKNKQQVMTMVNKTAATLSLFLMLGFMSCNSGPQPIKLGQDACSFCKMSIADNRFGGEIITRKGKVYKFDDMHCILGFMKANTINNNDIKETWLVNFEEPHNFIAAQKSFLLKSDDLHSPMGGNVAAFSDENKMKQAMNQIKGEIVTWNALVNEK